MRRSVRIAGLGLLVTLGVVVLLVLAVVGFVHTSSGREWVRGQVVERVNDAGAFELQIATLEGSLLRDVRVGGVQVRAVGRPAPCLVLDEARLAYRWWELLRGRIEVEALELHNPRVDVTQLPEAPAPAARSDEPQAPPPFYLVVERLALTGGEVSVAPGVRVDSVGVALSAEGPLGPETELVVRLAEARMRWPDQDLATQLGGEVRAAKATPGGALTGALDWRGRLAYRVEYEDGAVLATVDGSLEEGALGSFDPGLAGHPPVEVAVALNGDPLRRQPLYLTATVRPTGAAGGLDASAELVSDRAQVELRVDQWNPAEWYGGAPEARLDLQLAGHVSDLLAPLDEARCTIRLGAGQFAGAAFAGGTVLAGANDGTVRLDSLALAIPGGVVRAQARYIDPENLSARVRVQMTDVSPWSALAGGQLRGRLTVDSDLVLRGGVLAGELSARAPALAYGEVRTGALAVTATVAGRHTAPEVAFTGDVATVEQGDWQVGELRLEGGAAARGGAWEAALTAAGQLTGAALEPLVGVPFALAVDGKGEAERQNLVVREFVFGKEEDVLVQLAEPLGVEVAPAGVAVHGLDLRLGGGSVQGDLASDGGAWRGEVVVQGVDLQPIGALVPEAGLRSGRIDGRARLDGTVAAELAFTELGVAGAPVLTGTLGLLGEAESSRVELRVQGAAADSVHLWGTVPLRLAGGAPALVDGAIDLSATASLDSLSRFWTAERVPGGLPFSVGGALGGTPASPTADLQFLASVPVARDGEARSSAGGSVRLGAGEAQAEVWLAAADSARAVVCEARLPFDWDLREVPQVAPENPIEATLQIDKLDLKQFAWAVPGGAELAGVLDGQAQLTGTVGAPDFEGTLRLAGGTVEIPDYGASLTGVEVEAEFNRAVVRLARAVAETGKGRLAVTGQVPTPLTPDEPIDLKIQADRFQVTPPGVESLVASMDVEVGGTLARPAIGGQIAVEEALITVPEGGGRQYIQLTPAEIAEVDSTAARQVTAARAEPELDVAVEVRIPRNFWVRNKDIQIEIAGDLRATTQNDELGVFGELQSLRGEVEFQGKLFEVERGVVTFIGDADPEMDVLARHTTGEWTVFVRVGGSAQHPELTFYSEPPLPEAEVLSVLLFGSPSPGTDGQAVELSERAAGLAAGMASAQLEQALASQLGLAIVKIDATGEDKDITVGGYVDSKTLVKVTQSFEDFRDAEVAVEYALTPKVSVEVSANERGESGVDVLWRVER